MQTKNSILNAICFCLPIFFINTPALCSDTPCYEKSDKLYCGKGTVTDIRYVGDAVMDDTTVLHHTRIVGDFQATHVTANTMDIIGDFLSLNTTIQGNARIVGDVDMLSGHCENNLLLASETVVLKNSTTQNITFTTTPHHPIVYLDHTIINGDVKFPSALGTVYSKHGSLINGHVYGGKVIQQ